MQQAIFRPKAQKTLELHHIFELFLRSEAPSQNPTSRNNPLPQTTHLKQLRLTIPSKYASLFNLQKRNTSREESIICSSDKKRKHTNNVKHTYQMMTTPK
jgi:hypothetical protein